MKVTVNRTRLLELVSKVKLVIPRRATLQITQTILFQASSGKLILCATDLSMSAMGACKATVAAGGKVAANTKQLESFLKAVVTDKVLLSSKGKDKLTIEAGFASATIDGYDAKDYPSLPVVKGKEARIGGLISALSHVLYSASKN